MELTILSQLVKCSIPSTLLLIPRGMAFLFSSGFILKESCLSFFVILSYANPLKSFGFGDLFFA